MATSNRSTAYWPVPAAGQPPTAAIFPSGVKATAPTKPSLPDPIGGLSTRTSRSSGNAQILTVLSSPPVTSRSLDWSVAASIIGAVCIPGSIRRTGAFGRSCANAAPGSPEQAKSQDAAFSPSSCHLGQNSRFRTPLWTGVLVSICPRLITFHVGCKSRNVHVIGDVRRNRRRNWISVSGRRDQCGSVCVKRNAALEPIRVEAPSAASSNRYTR